jgi:two-component system sensor histidine kinase KdpD
VSIDRARLAEERLETEMLAETEKLRTALLTSISHDLRTPLASILGNISSLREYGPLYDEATRSEMLAFAENETIRMSRFVENLLYMTRIDAGALRPTIENFDLSDVIGSALERARKRTAQHHVQTDLPADLPMVPVDFVLAENVLVNLLDNAAKYSPQGSTITIAVTEQADHLRLTIADEGPGIPAEDLARVFERFFRAGIADQRRAGVGLGLAICKGFIEAMGGRIAAQNRAERSGAELVVTLPKVRAEAA